MPRLYLVRHAHAAASYGEDTDPGLDDLGHRQAEAMATALAPVGPLPMLVSPLRRTRETAAALEGRWNTLAIVDPGVAEIPSPSDDLSERTAWLRVVLGQRWPELGPRYQAWRTMVLELLLSRTEDTVVITHFVAVNVAIGAATGDDQLVCAPVGNASVTVFDHDRETIELVELGESDDSIVL